MNVPTSSPASKPRSKRKLLFGMIALVIVAVLLIPVALAGGFTVPIETLSFGETTGSIGYSNVHLSQDTVTVYQYYYSIRAGGMFRTTDSSNVSSTRGTTNITISMVLTNPSNQTIDLGNTRISGGIGTRSHTILLSIDQGVRVPGAYKLDVTITASVALLGVFGGTLSTKFQMNWKIS